MPVERTLRYLFPRPDRLPAVLAGVVTSIPAAIGGVLPTAGDGTSAGSASTLATAILPGVRTSTAMNVALVCSLFLAAGTVGWAVALPKQDESFTEFYLLTERENGTLVADDYPTEFVRGEGRPLVVGIGNQEGEPMDYTVVVALQRVRIENEEVRVTAEREHRRFEISVDAGGTWRERVNVTPTMTGTRSRLVFLLYEGPPPSDPSIASADRELHLWVNVTSPERDGVRRP